VNKVNESRVSELLFQTGWECGRNAMIAIAECADKEGMVITAMLSDPPTNCRVPLVEAMRSYPYPGPGSAAPTEEKAE
jgi:hypothetical protein